MQVQPRWGPHCLKGAGRRPQGAAALGPDSGRPGPRPRRLTVGLFQEGDTPRELSSSRGGGRRQLGWRQVGWKQRKEVASRRQDYPTAFSRGLLHPPSCTRDGGHLKVFLAGVGKGGVCAGRAREGRSYPDRTVSPAHPSPSHARGLGCCEFGEIRKGAGRKGAGPGAGVQGVL